MRREVTCWKRSFLCGLALSATTLVQAQSLGPDPKAQLPADQRAYKAATATVDPEKRLEALRQFVKDYPQSKRAGRAQSMMLTVLVKQLPDRSAEIDTQARLLVKQAGRGLNKWRQEGYIADELAGDGPHGVDLPAAEKWAADAAKNTAKLSEAKYASDQARLYKKYKIPAEAPAALHKDYLALQAEALVPLADVYLQEGRRPEAAALLARAYAMDPMMDEVNSLRGQLAFAEHRDQEALEDLERAQLLGELRPPWTGRMMELYKASHGGSDAGFVAAMDARYAALYPPTFTPTPKPPVAAGHTVLLELFTGSACPPCVGGDLAVDGLLQAYPRNQVVALAFDQHIPEPDPLANSDSVARAAVYGIASTPSYVIDGVQQPFYGGGRDDSEELYGKLTKVVDAQRVRPGAVELHLQVRRDASGLVQAQAAVSVAGAQAVADALADAPADRRPDGRPEALPNTLAPPLKPSPAPPPASAPKPALPAAAKPGPAAAYKKAAPAAPQLMLHFALVEDEVRYSGENGIRFHRMVVRALSDGSDGSSGSKAGPLQPETSSRVNVAFDPAQISDRSKAYLTDYQDHNDRFGKIEFLSLDTTIDPGHLAVVAWVQDAATHRVVQSVFVAVGEAQ